MITILEFYGIPGSGKSTVSHILASLLKEQGLTVVEGSYILDHKISVHRRKALKLIYSFFWITKNVNDAISIIKYFIGFLSIKDTIDNAINIFYKKYIVEKNKNSSFIIFDEGLVQGAISACIGTKKDVIECYKIIKRGVNGNTIGIYIKVDEKAALNRMNGRQSNDSRVEKEHCENKKIEMLKQFQKICSNMKIDKIVSLNGCDDPKINTHIIYKYLKLD